MGWKATMDVEREEAKRDIVNRLQYASNDAISRALESLTEENSADILYGYNFNVYEKSDKCNLCGR